MSTSTTSALINKTIAFVKKELEGNDASHDWFHIERVWKLAREIGKKENVNDLEVVELAALLHDVRDWKYSGSETEGMEVAGQFLQSQNYDPEKIEIIKKIITGVSFKNELAGTKTEVFKELAVVQDADRLDAIGAIGIGRVFCYSGKTGRAMYNPQYPPKTNMTKEQYMDKNNEQNTAVNHFYEKLLLLKGMMKTETGRKLAEHRHNFMLSFLDEFYQEWDGKL